ncbi:LOW QUALITY PROTEIN: aminopeptidase N-like [Uranotaenia lowii]|uniref:LOW QUALITY PROTEIN: aminopeptidase N-like n=1 Tax=Uranotaenia lowii TaxID=190385 RepID=UPI00247AE7DF|nr:LOW QUALITY PROTEIN: aminopeptidase N-like [Uranotaenia lowii]
MKRTAYLLTVCSVLTILSGKFVCGQIEAAHYRLPDNTFPLKYDVTLSVDLAKSSFSGTVRIALNATRNTDNVTLNVRDLNILATKLTAVDGTGAELRIMGYVMQNDSEMVSFRIDGQLNANRAYQLDIDFTGAIKNDLKGLYKSSYYRDAEERFIATTFNAAAFARKIFPCYDEPQLKAKFRLRIYHDRQLHALSNMPVERRTDEANPNGFSLTVFEESPEMSTYLLAFVVSDFQVRQLDNMFGAYAQQSVINSTVYALNFTRQAIGHMNLFFNRPYQLPKLDIVAVDDFLMGAMENWGLITYKTSRIAYREGLDKTEKLQAVTKIVFHELIHQWFGNEVTCAWWSYVWLNEGFAVFLESYVLDQMRPDWQIMDQFLVNEMHPVMERDVIPKTRPMTIPINSPQEIEKIYDFVVYPKAASVIRMIASIVGSEIFNDFIIQYLSDRSYNSSTEDDLIRVLQMVIQKHGLQIPTLSLIIKSWTSNPSFPLVSVKRDYSENVLQLSAIPAKTFEIPLSFISKAYASNLSWLSSTEDSKILSLENIPSSDWILLNPNQNGYYRVNYDTQSWNLLSQALQQDHNQIPKLSRAQLINDCLYFVLHKQLPVEILLDILSYLPHEKGLVPLKAGFKGFRTLSRLIRGNDLEQSYIGMQTKILEQLYRSMLNNTETDHVSKLYRYEVRRIACEMAVPQCLEFAINHFEVFETIDADYRSTVLCGAIKSSSSSTVWTMTLKRLTYIVRNFEQKRIHLEEFEDILYGLGCAIREDQATSLLLLSLSRTDTLEPADRIKMFNLMANSGVNGTNEALQALNEEYDTLKRNYGSVTEIVDNLRNSISTQEQLRQLNQIISTNTDLDLKPTLHEVYEEARQNVQWTDQNLPSIAKWIADSENLAAAMGLSRFVLVLGVITMFVNSYQ